MFVDRWGLPQVDLIASFPNHKLGANFSRGASPRGPRTGCINMTPGLHSGIFVPSISDDFSSATVDPVGGQVYFCDHSILVQAILVLVVMESVNFQICESFRLFLKC